MAAVHAQDTASFPTPQNLAGKTKSPTPDSSQKSATVQSSHADGEVVPKPHGILARHLSEVTANLVGAGSGKEELDSREEAGRLVRQPSGATKSPHQVMKISISQCFGSGSARIRIKKCLLYPDPGGKKA